MLLIGDVHGKFDQYLKIIQNTKSSLQLGDFGIGFLHTLKHPDMKGIKGKHFFLRGNHDNPSVCYEDRYYVGDYGTLKGKFGKFTNLFYISGAFSIDQASRIPDISWWENEELPYNTLVHVCDLFKELKPEIVCSHDCPTLVNIKPDITASKTTQAMDVMFNSHQPKYWFFAHHHMSFKQEINGCNFICLNELETIDISDLSLF